MIVIIARPYLSYHFDLDTNPEMLQDLEENVKSASRTYDGGVRRDFRPALCEGKFQIPRWLHPFRLHVHVGRQETRIVVRMKQGVGASEHLWLHDESLVWARSIEEISTMPIGPSRVTRHGQPRQRSTTFNEKAGSRVLFVWTYLTDSTGTGP
jgi:hypothetical protein